MNLQIRAGSWPQADALFRSDPLWRGSDDAYSVPLGDDRTLWLFGDTFIGRDPNASRRNCHFIRNSIGIQSGLDPSSATISFHWGERDGDPDSFFNADEGVWLWPLHGRLINGRLLLFFMKVRSPVSDPGSPIEDWREQGPLGFFEVFGYEVFVVSDPLAPVSDWRIEVIADTPDSAGIVCGASLLEVDDHLLSYGWRDKQGFLCRWPSRAASRGDLSSCTWWNGTDWVDDPRQAEVVLEGCPTEFTVHADAALNGFVQVQLTGVMDGWMSMRIAPDPRGPFGEPTGFHLTEESRRPGIFVYAGKAHPQLEGGRLICTYASNGRDVDETLDDDGIYYPRFVRIEQMEEK